MKHFYKLFFVLVLGFQAGSINAQCPNTLSIDLLQQAGNSITVATTFQAPSGSGLYVWNFGDGITETSGWINSHTYSQPGVYIVYLNLYDSLNTTWCAQGILTVQISALACNLQADFDVNYQQNGMVNFNNVTVSNGVAPYTYYWWFSDGQQSTVENPSLVFTNGNYQACLTVEDANGCYDSLCVDFVITDGPCQSDFITSQVSVNNNMLFAFVNNQNMNFPVQLFVDYGDGMFDQAMMTSAFSFQHEYAAGNGTYQVCFYATDNLGCTDTTCNIITISEQCNLQADFSIVNQSNGVVNFNNVTVSNGTAPYTYYWWFSDGQQSTLQNPSLIFNNGLYQACLTVMDANGCADSLCINFNVTNGLCSNNYLSGQPNVWGSELSLVVFNNNNINYPINISVEYGDGQIHSAQMSTAFTAFHIYDQPSTVYDLCVYAVDGIGCRDTLCYEIVTAPCVDSSLVFTQIPQQNNLYQFIAASNSQGPISYMWNYGDGSPTETTTVANAFHMFPINGIYQVCLNTVDADGCIGTFCQTVNVQGPCANFQATASVSYTGLTATLTPQVNSSCGGLTYSWSAPEASSTSGNQPFTVSYAAVGNYQVNLTATDDCGCSQTVTIPVFISCENNNGTPSNFNIQSGSITTCNGNFFDTGGQSGQYVNDENFTLTVYPATPNAKVRVNFSSFSCEANFDYLEIHNGNTVNSPTLANLTGTISGASAYTSTASDGSLTFKWISDFSITSTGWAATLTCQDLNIQSTNLQDGIWQLDAQSSTNYIDYIWLVDNQTFVTTVPTLELPLSEGFHQVCLTASSSMGCSQTTCTSIDVPCTYQLDVDVITNGNQVDFIINNFDSTMYYSLVGQNTQTWFQLTNDTTSITFPAAVNDYFCIWADGACFDSTCVQINMSTEGTQLVSGTVWNDVNGNGIFDNGELPMGSIYVTLCAPGDSSNCLYTYTDNFGMYNFNVFPGEYTLQSYVWQQYYLATNPVGGQGYNLTVADVSLGQFNFGWQNQSVTISGIVFYDTNNNGIQDAGENAASYKAVQIGNSVVYTNSSGHYTIQKLPGTYAISMVNPGIGYSISVPLSGSYSVNASAIGQVYNGNNFGLWADPAFADLSADIHQISTVTPGFPVMNHLSYCNNGVSASAGVFTYYWDPMLAITSASVFSPAPTTFNAASNSASWTFNALAPGACGYIYMNASAPQSLVLGTPVFNTAIVTPLTDANPSNNIDTLHQTVVGSWDPNDKQGVPTGIGPEGKIFPNTQLAYTIRFQNTGTAPAVNVVLIDTISTDFVLETFHMNASSDDYSAQVDQSTRTIRWIFNNIMLPDSTSDPIGSIGFVNFSIDPVQNQVDGTVLNNFADIYFDFNEPIRTNTTVHTIDRFLGFTDVENGPNVQVYPNPFTTSTTFLVKTEDNSRSEVVIHDILGKTVSSFLIESGKPFTYSASHLSSGMYFYTVTNNHASSTGKLVVK